MARHDPTLEGVVLVVITRHIQNWLHEVDEMSSNEARALVYIVGGTAGTVGEAISHFFSSHFYSFSEPLIFSIIMSSLPN
jgi:hypothetical protein